METALLIALLVACLAAVVLRRPGVSATGISPMTAKRSTSPAAPAAASAPSSFARTVSGTGLLASVKTWGYQLQRVNTKAVAASDFDLMVIDYSKDGSDEQAFTPVSYTHLTLPTIYSV